jgi:hypothetical protein
MKLTVAGAGPAGSTAAIAAALEGAHVTLFDPARFPRHKVCGEFLSPEMLPVLDQLGIDLAAAGPARIRTLRLNFPAFEKKAVLPDTAFGLSRHAFDHLLLQRAAGLGVELRRDRAPSDTLPLILAHGRHHSALKGDRLFGFKAHFDGPVNDAIELYFLDRAYIGVSCVENGLTNVCGLASEEILRQLDFDYDEFASKSPALHDRLAPLRRRMDWLTTGPLVFGNRLSAASSASVYPAGDALSFVDPFTGTGIAAAVISGRLAGRFAAAGLPVGNYLKECRRALSSPFIAASALRVALRSPLAQFAAAFVPANWLVRLTRPQSLTTQ